MDDFDDKLKSALRGERIEIGGEEIGSARGLVTELFRFRSRLITIGSVVKIVVAWGLAVTATIMTFVVEDRDERFYWGFGALAAIVSLGILWQFHWMMLNRNAVLREIKRLELQIAARDDREPS
ncbi:MAG: hypothetical protein NXI31_11210 [bacterium]|nr:hypothetical protein [bacterium]